MVAEDVIANVLMVGVEKNGIYYPDDRVQILF